MDILVLKKKKKKKDVTRNSKKCDKESKAASNTSNKVITATKTISLLSFNRNITTHFTAYHAVRTTMLEPRGQRSKRNPTCISWNSATKVNGSSQYKVRRQGMRENSTTNRWNNLYICIYTYISENAEVNWEITFLKYVGTCEKCIVYTV